MFSTAAMAVNIPIGFIAWDSGGVNPTAFDVVNQTGPNSGPDFPALTQITLSNLNLDVKFVDGSTATFGQAYFTLSLDGFSFDGDSLSNFPAPYVATLTGAYSPLNVTLVADNPWNSSTGTILPNFTATFDFHADGTPIAPFDLQNPDPLQPGDFKIFYADFTPNAVPEPGTCLLLGTGAVGMAFIRRKELLSYLRSSLRKG